MVGRDFEVGCKLGQGAVRAEALKSVKPAILVEARDARADERGGDAKRVGIDLGHGCLFSRSSPVRRGSGGLGPGWTPEADEIPDLLSAPEFVGVDCAGLLSEKADDRGDIGGDRAVEAEHVGDGEMAMLLAASPGEKEIGDAARLTRVGPGDSDQSIECFGGDLSVDGDCRHAVVQSRTKSSGHLIMMRASAQAANIRTGQE